MGVDTVTKNAENNTRTDSERSKPAKLVIDDRNLSVKPKPISHSSPASVATFTDLRPPKDNWDKITAVAPIVSGMLIFLMGGFFTYAYNQQQLRLQEIQTIEKFIPHLMGNEQSKKAAILAMSQLTNPELAGKFAGIFASTGTVSALQSMVENGNAHERGIATKALSDALESLAARETKLTAIQAEYQQAIQSKASAPDGDQDYMHNLSKLGEVYKLRGQSTLAEPLLKKSLAAREKLYGNDNPQVADALRSLAELYKMNGNSIEAANYLKRAHAIEAKYAPPAKLEAESSVPVAHSAPVHELVPLTEVEKPKETSEKSVAANATAASTAAEAKIAEEKKIRYIEANEEAKTKND
ncbi:MAG: tetratricopeptide repeat protein [Candidatus Melainabacteria bacterium]|nr:tetratricopeptide repeat protein [Candidatus Melainabacteria bacterium]